MEKPETPISKGISKSEKASPESMDDTISRLPPAIEDAIRALTHDFNNLLTAVTGHSDLLKRGLSSSDPLQVHADGVLAAVSRAHVLSKRLSAFTRPRTTQPRSVDVNNLITGLLPTLTFQLEENITLELDLSPFPGEVWCDPADLERTILLLVANAREAMPSGGRITLRTSPPAPKKGDRLIVSVEDTGDGMSEEIQLRLFEPFYTTKPPGKGAGLGLSAVYGMVKLAGGDIHVDSRPGKGSAFRLLFPKHEEDRRFNSEVQVLRDAAPGGETILLVEDDEEVRFLLQSILKSDGYHVLEDRDGERALEKVESHGGPIHLILTDLQMPRMGGRRLAETLLARHPGIKVMFMSGFSEQDFPTPENLETPVAFLQKPFMPKSMLRQVRKVLDQKSSPETGKSAEDRLIAI